MSCGKPDLLLLWVSGASNRGCGDDRIVTMLLLGTHAVLPLGRIPTCFVIVVVLSRCG
jgi:hypothetical protein